MASGAAVKGWVAELHGAKGGSIEGARTYIDLFNDLQLDLLRRGGRAEGGCSCHVVGGPARWCRSLQTRLLLLQAGSARVLAARCVSGILLQCGGASIQMPSAPQGCRFRERAARGAAEQKFADECARAPRRAPSGSA